jgi:hypothetical protein
MNKGDQDKIHGVSRREFIKCLSGAAASSVFLAACDDTPSQPETPENNPLSPRSKASNVFVNAAGKPLLVCVTGTNFETMLAAGLEKLGGLSRLIGGSQEVLIKPNCNAAEPYPGASDVNSLLSIIQEVKKVTSGTIRVGDQGFETAASVYAFTEMDPKVGQA